MIEEFKAGRHGNIDRTVRQIVLTAETRNEEAAPAKTAPRLNEPSAASRTDAGWMYRSAGLREGSGRYCGHCHQFH